MRGRRGKSPNDDIRDRAAAAYVLPDAALRAYDHGLGTLRIGGELKGYLASVVGKMRFPSRGVWPWFVVVWTDGTKEDAFEDYGPGWWTVRELDAGWLEYHEPSVRSEKRFFGMRFVGSMLWKPCRFDFEWLPPTEAASKWQELGLVDTDF